MPGRLYRVQAALQDVSNLARDQYVNTFHIWNPSDSDVVDPAFSTWADSITEFYRSLKQFLSLGVSGTLGTVKVYNLADELESPPRFVQPMNITGTGDSPGVGQVPMPNEVACCLTYHAQPQGGLVQRQSLRGRIYFGPLNVSAGHTVMPEAHGRPTDSFRNQLCLAGQTLHASLVAATGEWVVASKVQQHAYPIINYRVDDSWDTVRSRGDRPTTHNEQLATTHVTGVDAATPIAVAVR
jgi:hypothetical protein